jgi:hypothetical protein
VGLGGSEALTPEVGVDAAVRPDYPAMVGAFFLSAGFMLVETKTVVEMVLLFRCKVDG